MLTGYGFLKDRRRTLYAGPCGSRIKPGKEIKFGGQSVSANNRRKNTKLSGV